MNPSDTSFQSEMLHNAPLVNPKQSLKTRITSRLSSVKAKLRDKWKTFPLKVKLPMIVVPIVLIAGFLVFLFRSPSSPLFIGKNGPLVDSGIWDRLVLPERETPFFTLSTVEKRKFGIFPQEALILKTKEPTDLAFIKENMKSSVPVTVSSESSSEFKITPQKPLQADEVLSVALNVEDKIAGDHSFDRNYSWVYQAEPKLAVLGTLPANKQTEVPLNTGIEFKFNVEGYKDPTPYISISPNINFRVEIHGDTASIVPSKALDPMTVYTVTLKRGLSVINRNDTINEDKVFTFQTQEVRKAESTFNLSETFQQISPGDQLLTKVRTNNWDGNKEIKTQTYRFSSMQSFLASRAKLDEILSSWVYYYPQQYKVDTSNLTKVSDASLKVQSQNDITYLQVPGSFDEGFYLIQLSTDDGSSFSQLWIQSTPIAGYVSVGKEQTVVWVNKINGGAVANASIKASGTTTSTNGQGWAALNSPQLFFENGQHYVEINTEDNKQLAIPVKTLNGQINPGKAIADDYWAYLYNERVMYKTTDTVNFWGVVKNRDSNQAPSSATIEIGTYNYSIGGFDVVSKQTVSVTGDGSFIGSSKLENVPDGWYTMNLVVNGVTVSSRSFQVLEYTKPDIKLEVSANKKAVFAGDSVEFRVKASFFDGTPASKLPLRIYKTRGSGSSEDVTADENGEVVYTYTSEYQSSSENNYYPRYEGITVSPTTSNDDVTIGSGSVMVYGSHLQLQLDGTQKDTKATAKATVYNLNLESYNAGTSSDVRSGVAKNQKVAVKANKIWYEAKQIGTYYNFIEKVTRPRYSYERKEEKIFDQELTTNDQGQVEYNLDLEKERSYDVTVTTTDAGGRIDSKTQYFYYYQSSTDSESQSQAILTIDKEKNDYSLNDEVFLKIEKDSELYKDTDSNRFLFLLATRGRQEVVTTDNPTYAFTFSNKYIPNVHIGSVIFTGKQYEKVGIQCKGGWYCGGYDYYNPDAFVSLLLKYKQEDSKLTLNISADASKFTPGATAKITVTAQKDGSPAADATVNLVMVDEALAALGGVNKPSVLSTLYREVPNLVYYSYFTHQTITPDVPQAEKGGGGGDRDLFKDTAYFNSGKTNSEGKITFEVTLPDNITSWVTYAQAVTNNLDAGDTESSVIATKEFFVTNKFSPVVLQSDKPNVAVNAFGISLTNNVPLQIETTFSKDGSEIAKKNTQITAYKENYVPFPALTVGTYSVAVRGSYKNINDGVILPLNVISSRFDFEAQDRKEILSGNSIKGSDNTFALREDKPIKLVVTDLGKGRYYYDLFDYCRIYSNRLEKRLTKKVASNILQARFNDKSCIPTKNEFSEFQASDGGLRQVSWGSSDVETSLWGAYFAPELFDKKELARYFDEFVTQGQGTSDQKVYALWGSTLLGTPQITKLTNLAESATTYRQKALAALALYSAGLTEQSREMYLDILADYAYTNKPYIRIQSDKRDMDAYLLDTSLSLLLGSLVNKTYNEGLNLYVRDYKTAARDIILDTSDLAFIDQEISKLPDEDTTISFTSPVKQISKDLSKGGYLTIDLKPSEAKNFTLAVTKGKAEATTSYFVNTTALDQMPADNRFSISKTITNKTGSNDHIKIGDIVEVAFSYNFNSNAPLGCYVLTDYLPSGFSYIDNPWLYGLEIGQRWYMDEVQPNVARVCISNSLWNRNYAPNGIIYYAKANSSGTFIVEPTTLQSTLDRTIFQQIKGREIQIEPAH